MPSITIDIDEYAVAEALDDCGERELARVARHLNRGTRAHLLKALGGGVAFDEATSWRDIEAALDARNISELDRLLRPVLRAYWPRLKLTKLAPSPSNEDTNG